MPGIVRVQEFQVRQYLLKVSIKAFPLLGGSQRFLNHRSRRPVPRGETQFIAEDLHRGRHIERGERRIGGNAHQKIATIQFEIGETGVFPAEDESNLAATAGMHRPLRRLARVELRPGDTAAAGTGAEHYPAALHSLIQGIADPRFRQHIVGPRGPRRGLVTGKTVRLHQKQALQTHVLHGARRRSDISRVGGFHQYYSYVFQHCLDLRPGCNKPITCPRGDDFAILGLFADPFAKRGGCARNSGLNHPPMHALLNIAVSAARKAGSFISRALERVDTLQVDSKGYNDFVTEVDRRAEQEIIQVIHKAYPHHAILAEESGRHEGNESTWIIDPLDGTTNFLHGFPQFAVSIAMQHHGRLEVAAVYDPLRDELFTAVRGSGAQLNGRRLRVSKAKGLDGSLIGTGFPFKDKTHIDAYLGMFKALLPRAAGIRRAGSAALDLAYVSAGRLDGFWEIGLKPWDMAAGILLIQEAGGIVGDFRGGPNFFSTGNVVTGNARVFEGLVAAIQPYVTPDLQPGGHASADQSAKSSTSPAASRRRLTTRRAAPRETE